MVIAFIRGMLKAREISGGPADRLVVDVGGVGFEILVPKTTSLQSGDIGSELTIHTNLVVRENEWQLFGFTSADQKEMFTILQNVTGVGPKMALSLVGTLGPARIVEAIASEDSKTLSQAPGVGSKLAQRIILELKSKTEEWQFKAANQSSTALPKNTAYNEARTVLEGLGYTLAEINLAFKRLPEQASDKDVEAIVRDSLKVLSLV